MQSRTVLAARLHMSARMSAWSMEFRDAASAARSHEHVHRRVRILSSVLAVLLLGVVTYVVVPAPTGVRQVLYDTLASAALGIGFLGVRWHAPPCRKAWNLTLLGYGGWVVGDVVWSIEQHLIPDQYPAPSDILYLSAYVLLGLGTLTFVGLGRTRQDAAAILDAAIITVGATVLVGVFLIAPLTRESDLSIAGRVVSSAYPLGDIFLLGVIARMSSAPRTRRTSYRLLTGSMLVTLVTDMAWDLNSVINGGSVSSDWSDVGWLVGYLLIAAAACAPSMRTICEPAVGGEDATPTGRRLVVLTGALMLPGVTVIVEGAAGWAIAWPVVGIGMLVLSLLVLLRMLGLLKIVQIQAGRLATLARSDALTGAPNRRRWDQELARACATSREQGTPLSVAILDLDHFKSYNDTRGHQAGDQLLREAVQAWTAALPVPSLLARYGGEEFSVLFPGMNASAAADAVRALGALTPQGQTFSAGVALWQSDSDPASVIGAADEALYVAKRNGRDRVIVHTQEVPASATDRLPAFTIMVQPIFDIAACTVSAHEAVPWFAKSADRDRQSVFDQAYAGGYGDLLELAVLQTALALEARPRHQDLYIPASARALSRGLILTALPPSLDGIVIQLTNGPGDESLNIPDEAFHTLRQRGARIALDQIGTGRHDLARLATLRPDALKIASSLVEGCAEDLGRSAVLGAFAAYSDRLNVPVCATGVEHVADLSHLQDLGITHAQGNLLGRAATTWHSTAESRETITDSSQTQPRLPRPGSDERASTPRGA